MQRAGAKLMFTCLLVGLTWGAVTSSPSQNAEQNIERSVLAVMSDGPKDSDTELTESVVLCTSLGQRKTDDQEAAFVETKFSPAVVEDEKISSFDQKYRTADDYLYVLKDTFLYAKDDAGSKKLAKISYADSVHKTGYDPYSAKNWSQVEYNGKEGYVQTELLTKKLLFKKAKGTRYALKDMNLLKEPRKDAAKADSIEKDQSITMIGESKNWLQFRLRATGETVYAYKKYFTDEEPVIVEEPIRMAESERNSVHASDYTIPSPSGRGDEVANYALQFVGNPYVYGGTSLTNGTDCSGFTQSVLAHFGVSLSRSSYSQMYDGYSVGVQNMAPGDIVVYSGHVGICIGGGQIVHAANEWTGITVGSAYYTSILDVRRVI